MLFICNHDAFPHLTNTLLDFWTFFNFKTIFLKCFSANALYKNIFFNFINMFFIHTFLTNGV